MLLSLARASLLRHRVRTALAVLGVAVSAALLLDMVMLASGMRESFRSFLLVQGFQLRIAPKGTLPFDTEATLSDASAIVRALQANPDIMTVSPVLGGQLHVVRAERNDRRESDAPVTTFAIGIHPRDQGDYELLR